MSNVSHWKAAGAQELPWMLGVALIADGDPENDPKAGECLNDAMGAGYVPEREPAYQDHPAISRDVSAWREGRRKCR